MANNSRAAEIANLKDMSKIERADHWDVLSEVVVSGTKFSSDSIPVLTSSQQILEVAQKVIDKVAVNPSHTDDTSPS